MQVWLLCLVHRDPYFEGGAEIQDDVEDTLGGRGVQRVWCRQESELCSCFPV